MTGSYSEIAVCRKHCNIAQYLLCVPPFNRRHTELCVLIQQFFTLLNGSFCFLPKCFETEVYKK